MCRCFKTEQGLRTHVHMVHELAVAVVNGEKHAAPCAACGASFRTAAQLEAHRKRAHALEASACDTFCWQGAEASVTASAETPEFVCRLCGCVFSSAADEHAHYAWLQPVEVQEACEHCGKVCTGRRGLQQHLSMTACGSAAAARTAA